MQRTLFVFISMALAGLCFTACHKENIMEVKTSGTEDGNLVPHWDTLIDYSLDDSTLIDISTRYLGVQGWLCILLFFIDN